MQMFLSIEIQPQFSCQSRINSQKKKKKKKKKKKNQEKKKRKKDRKKFIFSSVFHCSYALFFYPTASFFCRLTTVRISFPSTSLQLFLSLHPSPFPSYTVPLLTLRKNRKKKGFLFLSFFGLSVTSLILQPTFFFSSFFLLCPANVPFCCPFSCFFFVSSSFSSCSLEQQQNLVLLERYAMQ